ncbi:PREDICTED: uncharacterized protein LOC106903261 [Poecilia mexicana]|uniref:uncharacterized protein LOC106903261 n=1 Tax=Poecilia mexicana TaxID=48701 RepID=UPI00072E90E0|nr:PREDICTED: uncharacterized protein LOC106903261 [Poecilia mexicana]
MKATFHYRHSMVNDGKKAENVFSVFPRFLDTPGLVEQDFRLLFGEGTANRFLEKWPTSLASKVIKQSHGLVPPLSSWVYCGKQSWLLKLRMVGIVTCLLFCICYHHLHKDKGGWVGTSVQQHLDKITQRTQPYLLAQGSIQSSIHAFFIVIDNYAIPCKATCSVGALDELFKARYVFGTSYSPPLTNFFTFLQTTVYNMDVGETKETPRVAELRARMLH